MEASRLTLVAVTNMAAREDQTDQTDTMPELPLIHQAELYLIVHQITLVEVSMQLPEPGEMEPYILVLGEAELIALTVVLLAAQEELVAVETVQTHSTATGQTELLTLAEAEAVEAEAWLNMAAALVVQESYFYTFIKEDYMSVHQIYSMIDDAGIIQCISTFDNYEDANLITRAVYGDNAIAVECQQYPCGPGDIFRDNRFWRVQEDGTEKEIEYMPTQEQQVAMLTAQLTETELALVEQYEANSVLRGEIIDTQLAIVDLYERKGV